jgi:RNA recognition motif-containing protein
LLKKASCRFLTSNCQPKIADVVSAQVRSFGLTASELLAMTTIYVGNLSFDATENDLRVLFEKHGRVHSVKIINDRETGRPRGFAFVELAAGNTQNLIRQTNGCEMQGRPLRVSEARERAPRPQRQDARC